MNKSQRVGGSTTRGGIKEKNVLGGEQVGGKHISPRLGGKRLQDEEEKGRESPIAYLTSKQLRKKEKRKHERQGLLSGYEQWKGRGEEGLRNECLWKTGWVKNKFTRS